MSPPASQAPWTVLDTCFGTGEGLLHWVRDRIASGGQTGLLHYVGLSELLPAPDVETPTSQAEPELDALRLELRAQLETALPGFQRFLLAQGKISLTLCIGPLRQTLSGQRFKADEVHLAYDPQTWDQWTIQELTRRCRRGTRLTARKPDGVFIHAMTAQGFTWQSPKVAIFDPPWTLRSTRNTRLGAGVQVARCAVIGGGLAGASVAHALSRRGWQVAVLDTHAHHAQGASGLPVGLVVPHVSVDDSPRSRLSRMGVGLMLQHAKRLLRKGVDWDDTGVLELTPDAQRRLNASSSLQSAGWLQSGRNKLAGEAWAATLNQDQSLWHAHAGWIKPACLVAAWLATPGIEWLGNSAVHRMEKENGVWALYSQDSVLLASAEQVVMANAMGAPSLLATLTASLQINDGLLQQLALLQALHGTVSGGCVAASSTVCLPQFPVNGSGSLITVSGRELQHWFTGATYERSQEQLLNPARQHEANLQRLQLLLPVSAEGLSHSFESGAVEGWIGTRCVSNDRLPLVGDVGLDEKSGVWISTAMGSRGLSFAALCAELLVARMGAEPLPVDARLARSLDASRPVRGQGAA